MLPVGSWVLSKGHHPVSAVLHFCRTCTSSSVSSFWLYSLYSIYYKWHTSCTYSMFTTILAPWVLLAAGIMLSIAYLSLWRNHLLGLCVGCCSYLEFAPDYKGNQVPGRSSLDGAIDDGTLPLPNEFNKGQDNARIFFSLLNICCLRTEKLDF